MVDLLDGVFILPNFYTVESACLGAVAQMAMEQPESSFDFQYLITASYFWGIRKIDTTLYLNGDGEVDTVYFNGVDLDIAPWEIGCVNDIDWEDVDG